MATISEVARMFNVERDTVKLWTSKFADHLSRMATPPKGEPRQYSESDLRVLALVFYYWEDDPDYEHIHAMLNSGDHESEIFMEHARLHTPIFQEVPDEIDETWQHGAIIGEMASRDRRQVARSYKLAADELVALALTKHEPHELDFPILFLYRHTVELYLKAALAKPPEHHDLGELGRLLEAEAGGQLPDWMRDRMRDFHEIDRRSFIFRYADPGPPGELWIDFHQLQVVIDKLVEAFEAYLASREELDIPIENLRNLGPTSSAWLLEINVHTRADLERIGPVLAYRLVKQGQPNTSMNLLWAMAAALSDRDWRELSDEEKMKLRREVEED